jgi:hypothetical protein
VLDGVKLDVIVLEPVCVDVIVLEGVCVDVIVGDAVPVPVPVEVSVEEDDFVRIRLVLGVPDTLLVSEAVEEDVLVPVGV